MKIHIISRDGIILDKTVKDILASVDNVSNVEVIRKSSKGLLRRCITCSFINVSKVITQEVPETVSIRIVD